MSRQPGKMKNLFENIQKKLVGKPETEIELIKIKKINCTKAAAIFHLLVLCLHFKQLTVCLQITPTPQSPPNALRVVVSAPGGDATRLVSK